MHVHARLAYDAYFAAANVAANGNIPFACAAYGPASCKSRKNGYFGISRGAQRTYIITDENRKKEVNHYD